MIFISHRGNLTGSNKNLENTPLQIQKVLNLGYDCEIDVWFIDNNYFLGHDEPKYKISKHTLTQTKLWCHAKNFFALEQMLKDNIHCFWHENDDYTITSKGYIWTNTGKSLGKKSVLVDLNAQVLNAPGYDINLSSLDKPIKGICSDYILDIIKI